MIRNLCLAIMVLVFFCVMPCHSATTSTAKQILTYEKKMGNHREDLITIAKNASAFDTEIAINLIALAESYSLQLAHINDLLLIESIIQSSADRNRVKPFIDRTIRYAAERIKISINAVNLGIAHSKNQGIIATATKLRDDLRELKELLESYN